MDKHDNFVCHIFPLCSSDNLKTIYPFLPGIESILHAMSQAAVAVLVDSIWGGMDLCLEEGGSENLEQT